MRTIVYIDGFNLYYGAVKGTPHKWLDLKTLCQKLLEPRNRIVAIKYFTARVSGANDPSKPLRQENYLRALKQHTPEIAVHYGHFLSHAVKAPLADPPDNGQRFVKVIKTEEKGSDVNLAVHLLNDAWLDAYDCAVVVSNDSDLAESLRLVKQHHRKVIGLIFPRYKGHPSRELMKYADFVKKIRPGVLASSQLPSPIPCTNLHKPEEW
jgi:uncharacterized LabA/DUF88 family protein